MRGERGSEREREGGKEEEEVQSRTESDSERVDSMSAGMRERHREAATDVFSAA